MVNEIDMESFATNKSSGGNIPEMSVSELSGSLKRTLEETYGRVRIRGELSRVSIAASGHMYSDLKDENALINLVCWKGVMSKLSIKPEEGMEVICTGRVSAYPSRSNYQLIVESIELAGEGALLKLLEDRKKKLAGEGLFDQGLKKPLPFLPKTIGVVTSPTGAVIRDIMHRLKDRFPRHVLVWPVLVQGDGAADQITAAIKGFDSMKAGGTIPRPDLIIVARGGGSLEDLMAFNEENVVRAVAECSIPVISAVGHETDTTLIDYVSDRRAPTPTGAAEIAVPRRMDLMAQITDWSMRLTGGMDRYFQYQSEKLHGLDRRLGDPNRLTELHMQKLDQYGQTLDVAFGRRLQQRKDKLADLSSRLKDPVNMVREKHHNLNMIFERSKSVFQRNLDQNERRLSISYARLRRPSDTLNKAQESLARLSDKLSEAKDKILPPFQNQLDQSFRVLDSLSYNRVLARGYTVIRADNTVITDPESLKANQTIEIEFHNDRRVPAQIEGGQAPKRKSNPVKDPKSSKEGKKSPENQGKLF